MYAGKMVQAKTHRITKIEADGNGKPHHAFKLDLKISDGTSHRGSICLVKAMLIRT